MIKTVLVVLMFCTVASPVAAQQAPGTAPTEEDDELSVRAVGFVVRQQFAAKTTFDGVFGQSDGRFFGGGVLLVERGVFLELTISHFEKQGSRAYLFNGQAYSLGIPLKATVTPFEVSAGYRFFRHSTIIPYLGVGIGSYGYKETSDFANAGDDVDVRHAGFLVVGGAEVRLHRLIGIAVDVQRTRISGILGTAGISKDAGEDDLGGTSIRAKVIFGR